MDKPVMFQRSPEFADCTVDRAAVILNAEKHLYFGVNRVGARIWALLSEPRSTDELVRALTGEFSVDEPVCRKETEAFLRELHQRHLIVRKS